LLCLVLYFFGLANLARYLFLAISQDLVNWFKEGAIQERHHNANHQEMEKQGAIRN
jgi:hypothetical protein